MPYYQRDAAQRPILPKGQGTKALFYRRDADTQPPNTHVRAVSSKYRKGRGCSSNPRPSLGSRRPEQQLKPKGRGSDATLTDGTRHECHTNRRDAAWMPISPKGRSKGTGLLLESQTFIRVPQTGAAIKTGGTRHGCLFYRRDTARRPILPKGRRHPAAQHPHAGRAK